MHKEANCVDIITSDPHTMDLGSQDSIKITWGKKIRKLSKLGQVSYSVAIRKGKGTLDAHLILVTKPSSNRK